MASCRAVIRWPAITGQSRLGTGRFEDQVQHGARPTTSTPRTWNASTGRNGRKLDRRPLLARLPAWGFNTVGNWSDPPLWDAKKMPYTVTIDPWPAATRDSEPAFAEVSSGNDYWKRMADPFDPRYAEALDRGVQDQATEVSRRSVVPRVLYRQRNVLGLDEGRPVALRARAREPGTWMRLAGEASLPVTLEKKYKDVGKLNQAWGTQLRVVAGIRSRSPSLRPVNLPVP